MPKMRLLLACFSLASIAACAAQQSQSEHALARYNDEWREKQVILYAEAILKGMAQARQRQEQVARSAR
jgi:hypothetical protein